jgi:[ribosomal protein S5]-alanine N-acetyltransferase
MSGRLDVRSFVYIYASIMSAMKPPEIIETHRLILRPPRPQDAFVMFERWATDPKVTYYLTWRPHSSLEQSQAFVARAIAAWTDEMRFPYMIAQKENGEVMGMIDPRLEGTKVGIGYVIGCAYWGKGYMPEATSAVIDWAFQQSSIYRVYATTDVENRASQRMLEKVGMQREGILRKYITHPNISHIPRDSYMYATIR